MDVTLNDPFELPSLEEIQEMDSQRSQAIQDLEISNDSVKCQQCGTAVPMLRTSTKPSSIHMLYKSRSGGLRITAVAILIDLLTSKKLNPCQLQ